MKRILLFSGGLDSVIGWWLLRPDECVYVTWCAPYEAAELRALERLRQLGGPHVRIVPGPTLPPPGLDGHVPHRNLALLVAAAAACPDASTLLLGAVLGESSADKSGRFLRRAGAVLTASEGRRVRVRAPLRRRLKRSWVKKYLAQGGPVELLAASVSCYSDAGEPCGACPACFRRWQALTGTGVRFYTAQAPDSYWREARARGPLAALERLRAHPVAGWPGVLLLNLDAAWRVGRAGRPR